MEEVMKKKIVAMVLCICMGLAVTACGGQTDAAADAGQTQDAVQTEDVAAEEEDEVQTAEEQEVQAPEDAAEEQEAEAPEDTADDAATDDAAVDPEVIAFADQIKEAVAAKDLDALGGLIAYPVYVGIGEGSTVESADGLAEIGADAIFDDSLVEAIDAFDNTTLTEVGAGYVMGDGKPNVIFARQEDGSFGITGINY